jgi:hypothetical protein
MKFLRVSTILASAIVGVTIILTSYSAISIYTIYDWVGTGERDQWVTGATWISLLAHLLLLAWTVYIVSRDVRTRMFGCLTIVTGIVSAIFFLSDLLGLNEMAKEIP